MEQNVIKTTTISRMFSPAVSTHSGSMRDPVQSHPGLAQFTVTSQGNWCGHWTSSPPMMRCMQRLDITKYSMPESHWKHDIWLLNNIQRCKKLQQKQQVLKQSLSIATNVLMQAFHFPLRKRNAIYYYYIVGGIHTAVLHSTLFTLLLWDATRARVRLGCWVATCDQSKESELQFCNVDIANRNCIPGLAHGMSEKSGASCTRRHLCRWAGTLAACKKGVALIMNTPQFVRN